MRTCITNWVAFLTAIGPLSIANTASASNLAAGTWTKLAVTEYVVGFSQEPTNNPTDWTNVNDGGFVSYASKAGCAVVTFSAEAGVYPGGALQVRAMLDGTTECTPISPLFVQTRSDDSL